MLTTLSIIFLVLSLPFLVQVGRNRSIFSTPPNLTSLRRTISVPTITTRRRGADSRPRGKRRATEGDETVTSTGSARILRDPAVAEPNEDDAMLSDTSVESYVRFGRGMTYVDRKVGGGIVRSSVDYEDRTPRHPH